MATFNTVRKLALALDGVEESTMYGSPALKLHGRLVACLAVHRSAEPGSLVVRTDFDERANLLAEEPETYYLTDHYLNHPLVLVRLSRIKSDQLRDLLGAAWRFISAQSKRKISGRVNAPRRVAGDKRGRARTT